MPTDAAFRQGDSVVWRGMLASVVLIGEKKATICLWHHGIPDDDDKMIRVVAVTELRR